MINNNKITLNNFFIKCALLLSLSIILIRPYMVKILKSTNMVGLLLVAATFLLIIHILLTRRISINNTMYILLCLVCVIPFFYKNAYIEDGYYAYFIYYIGSITFGIILSYISIKHDNIEFVMKIFLMFAITTSLVTWFSCYFPNSYDKYFISLLPSNSQVIARRNFWNDGMRMGLSDHYSRNAFYLIVGMLSSMYFYIERKNKKYIFYTMFFMSTIMLIGKRAHFIFIIISLILSYLIYSRVSMKKIMKLLLFIVIGIFIIGIIINIIPSTSNLIERLFDNTQKDISTGRFELYENIWSLYKRNSYRGIGWGQFSKMTNYYFAGAHNDYLQLLCETGVIGLIMILSSNLIFLKKSIICVRKAKQKSIYFIILVYQIFFLLYSFTGLPHYDVEVHLLYFIFNSFLWNYREVKLQNV